MKSEGQTSFHYFSHLDQPRESSPFHIQKFNLLGLFRVCLLKDYIVIQNPEILLAKKNVLEAAQPSREGSHFWADRLLAISETTEWATTRPHDDTSRKEPPATASPPRWLGGDCYGYQAGTISQVQERRQGSQNFSQDIRRRCKFSSLIADGHGHSSRVKWHYNQRGQAWVRGNCYNLCNSSTCRRRAENHAKYHKGRQPSGKTEMKECYKYLGWSGKLF